MLIEKKNKKKREIESSDEDSRWQFFTLVVIVYTKIRQAYSLFVFHARVTPCRHTRIVNRRMSAILHLREQIKFYRKFSFTHHFAWINDSTEYIYTYIHTSILQSYERELLSFTMPFIYPLKSSTEQKCPWIVVNRIHTQQENKRLFINRTYLSLSDIRKKGEEKENILLGYGD